MALRSAAICPLLVGVGFLVILLHRLHSNWVATDIRSSVRFGSEEWENIRGQKKREKNDNVKEKESDLKTSTEDESSSHMSHASSSSSVSFEPRVIEAISDKELPVLKLAFLHMRKSGGTHINKILTEFMVEHDCMAKGVDPKIEQKVGVRGIRDGVPLDMTDFSRYHINYTEHPPRCKGINMIHEEMLSFDGREYLAEGFPQRGHRADKSFSLLTTIRDPIERIGSQAFYGKYSVARTVVSDLIRNNPDPSCDYYKELLKTKQGFNPIVENEVCSIPLSGPRNVACECFRSAMNQTREIIRTNETVWFHWIKNVVGYQDEYMSNYFIKRLVAETAAHSTIQSNRNFREGWKCIQGEENQCNEKDSYKILSNVFVCQTGVGFNHNEKMSPQVIV